MKDFEGQRQTLKNDLSATCHTISLSLDTVTGVLNSFSFYSFPTLGVCVRCYVVTELIFVYSWRAGCGCYANRLYEVCIHKHLTPSQLFVFFSMLVILYYSYRLP